MVDNGKIKISLLESLPTSRLAIMRDDHERTNLPFYSIMDD
jgi:hypothetical protein